jgi:hypothetical protein
VTEAVYRVGYTGHRNTVQTRQCEKQSMLGSVSAALVTMSGVKPATLGTAITFGIAEPTRSGERHRQRSVASTSPAIPMCVRLGMQESESAVPTPRCV